MASVGNISGRVNQNRRFYTTEADLEKASFEPGISADIDFVTIIAVKIALDLLNRNNPNYKPRVINHLTQFTLICNTCDPDTDPMFTQPLQITTSIIVPYAEDVISDSSETEAPAETENPQGSNEE